MNRRSVNKAYCGGILWYDCGLVLLSQRCYLIGFFAHSKHSMVRPPHLWEMQLRCSAYRCPEQGCSPGLP